VAPGSLQAAATLGTGVVDLLRLAGITDDKSGRRREAYRLALERSEQVVREYKFDGRWPLEGWEAWKDCGRFQPRDGILEIEAIGPDFQMAVPPDFDCGLVQRVLVRARVSGNGNRGHLFWMTEEQPVYDDIRSIQFWLHPGGQFHTYTIEVGEDPDWDSRITGIRLDPTDRKGRVEIDSIIFMSGLNSRRRDLLAARCGLPDAAVELQQDRRRVLAVDPGAQLDFRFMLEPRDGAAPELRFAIGLAAAGPDGREAVPRAAHRFTVRGRGGAVICDRVLDPARTPAHRGWVEERVELDPAGGRPAGLTLAVEVLGDNGDQEVCALFANPLVHQARRPGQTSMLVILVDALRADRLGCYGHPGGLTPHMNRFRRQGALFRHAQSSSSWTAPAVASLFTGLQPYRHGVRYVDTLRLAGRFETVAERFLEAGWFTGAVSDNLLITPDNGFDQGFRTFVSKPPGVHSRKAVEVTDLALAWLDRHGDRPFFLYLHYMDPHADYQPRQPFHPGPAPGGAVIRTLVEQGQAGGVVTRMQREKDFRLSPAEEQRLLDLYEGEIAATDFELGRLLARLERDGLAEDTVVVFVADHGEEFLDHGKYTHANSLFDELVQVPLIIRLPGRGQIRQRVDAVVRTADLGPSLFELAGAPGVGDEVLAGSFAGRLDPVRPQDEPVEAYFEINPYSRSPMAAGWVEATRGLRVGNVKLLYEVRTGRYSLYDLDADPGEHHSLYDERDSRSVEMAARLARYLEEAARSEEQGSDAGLLEDRQLQQLDALGYLDR
jgi:arylsulfatase A-like enzyme